MSRIHPTTRLQGPLGAGDYREQDVLHLLESGLPDSFDVFHNVPWSTLQGGQQHFGEIDITVVSPLGHILLLEVKAGAVEVLDSGFVKNYGAGGNKDIGQQVRRQHSALLQRIKKGELPSVHLDTLLVLPDHSVHSAGVGYPRERIIDATQLPNLCKTILDIFSTDNTAAGARQKILDFFVNRFQEAVDVSTYVQQVQGKTAALASGLATWVPKVSHTNNLFVIQATAGSGKTQLALKLMQDAVNGNKQCAYVCFNRPLADHMSKLVPAKAEVSTFHQLCRDWAERAGETLVFSDPAIFERITQSYLEASAGFGKSLALLIVDESQDFEPAWVMALAERLKSDGKLYVMGDAGQQIYDRDGFALSDAVHIECSDNFRSPQKVVKLINQLGLCDTEIISRSAHAGEMPQFYTWAPGKVNSLTALNHCLNHLWQEGFTPEQVAVISYRGQKNSEALAQTDLGGYKTKRFSHYDANGNALWTDGALLVDTVNRFKGQSMPVVVLCEVDFETLSEKEKCKLFVGLTRAQVRVDIVMSERSANLLLES